MNTQTIAAVNGNVVTTDWNLYGKIMDAAHYLFSHRQSVLTREEKEFDHDGIHGLDVTITNGQQNAIAMDDAMELKPGLFPRRKPKCQAPAKS